MVGLRLFLKPFLMAAVLLIYPVQASQAQDDSGPPLKISKDEAKRLADELKKASDISIRIENAEGAPVTISDARIKAALRKQPGDNQAVAHGDYAIDARIIIANNTDQRVKRVRLAFASLADKTKVLYDSFTVDIKPRSTAKIGERPEGDFPFFPSPANPDDLLVKVVAVRFEDGKTWGNFPPVVEVDTRPVALNRPRPNYTDRATEKRVEGDVRVRVLVGEDGTVKQARITKGLPEGLNEEALNAVFQIRFKPAMKDGKPVANWMTIELQFRLAARPGM
jgi:TonB family protein